MNYQDVTKDELIKELQVLLQKHSSLKTAYSKAISEFRIAEKTSKESEERYRFLFENSTEAFLLTNPDGSVYSANPEACRIFGMGEHEICKLGRDGIVDSDDPQLYSALIERRKTGKFKGELNLLRKDRTKFPAEVTSAVFRDISGNERTSMIIRDISEKKQTEKQLHLQSEIMKNISEGICLVRIEDEKIVFTNPKFDEMFGYELGEMIGKNVSLVNAPTDKSPEEIKNAVMDVIIRTGEWHGEILNIKKNGDHFWCYANVSVFDHHDYGKVLLSVHSDITERKLAEEALQKSNNKFMSLADKISGYIAYVNADTLQYEFVNSLYEKSFGIPQEKIIGSHIKDIIGETNYQFALKYINEVRSGKSISYENTFNLDSEKRWLQIKYSPVFNEKGYVASIVLLGYDITEQKQAEEALQKSEKLLRIVISNAPISIFATNEKGIFILHEGKALEKTGMKPGENVGVSAYELFSELNIVEHDGKVTNGKSLLNRVLNGESLSGFTELNGVHFDNQFVPLRNINDQVIGLIGVATDVTTSKKVEEALIESEAKFRSLFDNSHVGISAASKDGRLIYANLAYAKMYGYENPEIMLSEVTSVAKLYANPVVRKTVKRSLNRYGKMKEKEFELLRRDGSRFFVLVSVSEVRNADGKLLYNQATHIDLTERKKMEEDLRNSKKSLEKLNRHLLEVRENERSQIALNLHDDFGQRLTALNLDIAWLKSRMGVQSEPVRKKFEEMSLMINDSIESIREVSSFLRPEVLYDLGLVPAIGWQLKKFEKQSGIHCQYTFNPGDIKIDDSISLILYRILQEALTNIVRHSEATTTVVDIRLERNRIEMVIKDDGKGIDENEINSLKSMGIAGMMERVRSVSGRMSVKGKKGSGTIIKISIPLKISKNNDQRTYNR